MRSLSAAAMVVMAMAAIHVAAQSSCDSYLLPTSAPSPSRLLSVDSINNILIEHNNARRTASPAASTMPMLVWNQTLADYAQNYMEECNGLTHSPSNVRSNESHWGFRFLGSNIAAGSTLTLTNGGQQTVRLWVDEKSDFTFPTTCAVGRQCAHFTTLMGSSATAVGCGWGSCPNLQFRNYWNCIYGFGPSTHTSSGPYPTVTGDLTAAPCQLADGVTLTPAPPASPSSTGAAITSGPTTVAPSQATATSAPAASSCDSYLLPTTQPSPSTVLTVDAINSILVEHNNARRTVSPPAASMPMLVWDQTLADFAQEYMDGCPGMTHSTSAMRSNPTRFNFSYIGENLAAGTSSTSYGVAMGGRSSTAAWNDEVRDWTYPRVCNSGAVCGHYTQVIWAGSTHVGCGYRNCPNERYRNYWSCVYGPGGNIGSRAPYTQASGTTVAACQSAVGALTPAPIGPPAPTTTLAPGATSPPTPPPTPPPVPPPGLSPSGSNSGGGATGRYPGNARLSAANSNLAATTALIFCALLGVAAL